MGVYYKIACDAKQESIDPGHINNLGIKGGAIAHLKHPVGSLVMFALGRNWAGCTVRLENDTGDDWGYFEYKDVTEEIIRAYNLVYETDLKFTGG